MEYRLCGVSKAFGAESVLHDLDLSIHSGEILVVLGPSGCGKTTLLNLVAGILRPDAGERSGFEAARFAYAFQEPRLLPWLSAMDNLRFALSGLGLEPEALAARLDPLLEAAGLSTARDKRPHELSGGMRQRLSLVRAFAYPAEILLLDEAFQAVDLKTKIELMDVFLGLWHRERRTSILVTHDIEEAVYLADRIVVLSQRPARIVDDFHVSAPREDRNLGSTASLGDEARLYRRILGQERAEGLGRMETAEGAASS